METFSALLAICVGNSLVTGRFPAQRPVTRSFDISFHLCLNKRLSKKSLGWWFETPSRSLGRHRNEQRGLTTEVDAMDKGDSATTGIEISFEGIAYIATTPGYLRNGFLYNVT